MKINIKIEGLGINTKPFVEYFKNNGIKQPAVYITPRVICDKEGNIKNFISFDLHEYDRVKYKEDKSMDTLTYWRNNVTYDEIPVGSIWKFRDDKISRNVGNFIKVASVNNDQIKWVSINHTKDHNMHSVFSKGTLPLSSFSKYCEKVMENDIGAKYRLVANSNTIVEVQSTYPSFNNDNGDVSGFVQYVDDIFSLRYELHIDEFHMKYDLISLPENHTENNESDKASPKSPETKTEPDPASTYLKTDKSKLETFSTGAKREDKSGKGRYDLIPGDIMNDIEDLAWTTYFQNGVTTCSATDVSKSAYFEDWTNIELYYDFIINMISYFFIPAEKRVECIDDCGEISYEISWDSFRSGIYEMRKQLALHYEAGAIVHGVDNWKKGIPIYGSDKGGCFLDSMRRHTDQALQDKTDEPHDVAAIWNAFGAAWTLRHRPHSAIYQNASVVKADEASTYLLRNKQTTKDVIRSLKSLNDVEDGKN